MHQVYIHLETRCECRMASEAPRSLFLTLSPSPNMNFPVGTVINGRLFIRSPVGHVGSVETSLLAVTRTEWTPGGSASLLWSPQAGEHAA